MHTTCHGAAARPSMASFRSLASCGGSQYQIEKIMRKLSFHETTKLETATDFGRGYTCSCSGSAGSCCVQGPAQRWKARRSCPGMGISDDYPFLAMY